VIAGEIIRSALAKGKRVIFTVPAIELIDQTARSFWAEGIRDVGVLQASHAMTDPTRPVQVASIQTPGAAHHPARPIW
jgi:DNA repair protein RadD